MSFSKSWPVFSLIFGLFGTEASATPLKVSDLGRIQKSITKTESEFLTVDFEQEKKGLRDKTWTRKGQAQFAKSGKFVWTLLTPTKDVNLYDGKDFYKFDPETNSAVRYAPTGKHATELRQIIDLVLNFDTLLKHYDFVSGDEQDGTVQIDLRPKNAQMNLTAASLTVDKKLGYIGMLKLNLADKTSLTYHFKNPDRAKLKDDTFALAPGVKVKDGN